AALTELARLYSASRIAYEQRRNELLDWFGCTKGAVDADVENLTKHRAIPQSNDDPVNELVAIAKREARLWHNTIRIGYASFHRDGHLENTRLIALTSRISFLIGTVTNIRSRLTDS